MKDNWDIILTTTPLKQDVSDAAPPTHDSGATVVFGGTVRKENNSHPVVRLEFEAYEPMAVKELERIFAVTESQWEVFSLLLHHRLGTVLPGELAVLVRVTCRHRKSAFEACAFIMDELKKSVPIWKKEVFSNGESWVSPTP